MLRIPPQAAKIERIDRPSRSPRLLAEAVVARRDRDRLRPCGEGLADQWHHARATVALRLLFRRRERRSCRRGETEGRGRRRHGVVVVDKIIHWAGLEDELRRGPPLGDHVVFEPDIGGVSDVQDAGLLAAGPLPHHAAVRVEHLVAEAVACDVDAGRVGDGEAHDAVVEDLVVDDPDVLIPAGGGIAKLKDRDRLPRYRVEARLTHHVVADHHVTARRPQGRMAAERVDPDGPVADAKKLVVLDEHPVGLQHEGIAADELEAIVPHDGLVGLGVEIHQLRAGVGLTARHETHVGTRAPVERDVETAIGSLGQSHHGVRGRPRAGLRREERHSVADAEAEQSARRPARVQAAVKLVPCQPMERPPHVQPESVGRQLLHHRQGMVEHDGPVVARIGEQAILDPRADAAVGEMQDLHDVVVGHGQELRVQELHPAGVDRSGPATRRREVHAVDRHVVAEVGLELVEAVFRHPLEDVVDRDEIHAL